MIIPIIIGSLASMSYYHGISAVLKGQYKPNIYSRVIWFLITLNSFLSVVFLHNNPGVLVLAGVQFAGSLAMLLVSLKYSVRKFDLPEIICSVLLLASLIIWVVADSPIINLIIGLIAHFIGAIPTYASVIKKPRTENIRFWLYFMIASLITIITTDRSHFRQYLFASYFAAFDSSMLIFSARRYLIRKKSL